MVFVSSYALRVIYGMILEIRGHADAGHHIGLESETRPPSEISPRSLAVPILLQVYVSAELIELASYNERTTAVKEGLIMIADKARERSDLNTDPDRVDIHGPEELPDVG
jgi:hypothetical protein